MNHRHRNFLTIIYIIGFQCVGHVSAQENLSVLSGWRKYSGSGNFLYDAISREAFRLLDEREDRIADLQTRDDWLAYQATLSQQFARAFGPLPQKTPLNARITGTFEHQGITVEKIIYESRPGLWVTSCLFKPSDAKGKLPAVLFAIGHSAISFRRGPYQHVIMNLARKGFAVFTIDPIGQGERYQYYDEREGRGKHICGDATNEHSYIGLQYLAIGRTVAMVRLWDCIRAVDYLCGRDDVDSTRIGVQGISGGGTMSSYLSAMEPRITAAAPECYITSFRRLYQSIGAQDGCQNLFSQIALGLDHGDFLIASAPAPTLVIANTRDFFSIQGARETVASVRPAFRALGVPQNIQIIEADDVHTFAKQNQDRKYAFFMDVFDVEGDEADEDIPEIERARLQVTKTGQAITSGSRTVHDYIRMDAESVLERLEQSRSNPAMHRERVRTDFLAIAGIGEVTHYEDVVFTGRFKRDGYSIEKVILDDGNIPIPALVFVPDGDGPFKAILLADHLGKAAKAAPGMFIERLVRNGYLVIACDLPGCGELRYDVPDSEGDVKTDDSVIDGFSFNLFYGAQLVGKSITGIQAEALLRVHKYLSDRDDVMKNGSVALSYGTTGPALMHAVAMDKSLKAAAFIGSPLSWESVIMHRFYDPPVGSTVVAGALDSYDLPDILSLCAPRNILVMNPLDGDGKPAPGNLREKNRKVIHSLYGDDNINRVMIESGTKDKVDAVIISWLESL